MQIDPTRTKMIRIQYERQLTSLYKYFAKKHIPRLIQAVIEEQQKHKNQKHSMGITDDVDKYLDIRINGYILTPSKNITKHNITEAYTKGVKKANKDLQRGDSLIPLHELTPGDYEAITNLMEINFNRIKDCTTNMKNAITYSCTKGVMNGWGSDKIAYELMHNVEGNNNMGIVRARMIARTETINAYNTASETRYKSNGYTRKDMVWITAFDERTCDECVGNDEKTIETIGEIPPVHPNCRCSIALKTEE